MYHGVRYPQGVLGFIFHKEGATGTMLKPWQGTHLKENKSSLCQIKLWRANVIFLLWSW